MSVLRILSCKVYFYQFQIAKQKYPKVVVVLLEQLGLLGYLLCIPHELTLQNKLSFLLWGK